MALPALALGTFLLAGCGPSTTNEDTMGPTVRAPVPEGTPVPKTYAEYAKAQNEQAAKSQQAGKGKAVSKGQPKTQQEPPKAP